MIRLLTAAPLLLLAACTTSAPESSASSGPASAASSVPASSPASAAARDTSGLVPERGAVLPEAAMPQLLRQCSRAAPDSAKVSAYWTPTPVQIRELEAGLTPLLRERLKAELGSRARPGDRVSRYNRQYAGLVLNGRRIIYVNGFMGNLPGADRDTARWREGPAIMVCDGWFGFFGVEYDPETKQFRNFSFNGIG